MCQVCYAIHTFPACEDTHTDTHSFIKFHIIGGRRHNGVVNFVGEISLYNTRPYVYEVACLSFDIGS